LFSTVFTILICILLIYLFKPSRRWEKSYFPQSL
jgi:hypothetical protein